MKALVFARHPQGGIKTYCGYMYGNPAMEDVAFTLLTPVTDSADYFRQKLGSRVNHIQIAGANFSLLRALIKLLVTEKPDILHSHGFTAGILAALPARLLGVKHVVTTHDIFQQSQFRGLKGIMKRLLVGAFLKLADCINPVGDDARENLLSYYPGLGRGEKVRAIRNGIDTRAFLSNGRRDLRGELNLAPDQVLLGFFGRFMAQKGFRILVDLVDRWNQAQSATSLQVACFGWGGFIREEQQDLRSRNLIQYFHFFDNTDDMPSALRGVDAVVMPSRWEACPLLAMEALTAGAPLIASDCIGNKEVTRNTPALVFRSESVESFEEQVQRYLSERPELQVSCEAFRAVAAERYDVNLAAQQLRQLFGAL